MSPHDKCSQIYAMQHYYHFHIFRVARVRVQGIVSVNSSHLEAVFVSQVSSPWHGKTFFNRKTIGRKHICAVMVVELRFSMHQKLNIIYT